MFSNKKPSILPWYWWTLLTLYTAAMIAVVLKANPYLYSHIDYEFALVGRKSEQPLKFSSESPGPKDDSSPETQNLELWGRERWGSDPTDIGRGRRFVEESTSQIQFGENFNPKIWSSDSKGTVFIDASGRVISIDWDGFAVWKFKAPAALLFFKPSLDAQRVLLTSREGHVYSLDRTTGSVLWYSRLGSDIYSSPIRTKTKTLIALKPWIAVDDPDKETPQALTPILVELNLQNGEMRKFSKPFSFEKELYWSLDEKSGVLLLAHEKSLLKISLETLEVQTQKDFESPLISAAMILPRKIVSVTQDGRAYSLKPSLEVEYEIDLGSASSTPPLYIPSFDRLAFMNDSHYLQVVSAEDGERRWRFNLQNELPQAPGWSSRLNNLQIEELSLGWKFKGWSLWIPCAANRVCIYNPDQGQIIGRIFLSGNYRSVPLVQKSNLVFILEENSQWKIARYIEK